MVSAGFTIAVGIWCKILDIQRLVSDEAAYGSYYEFPTINSAYYCRPYRYSYGAAAVRPTNIANAIVK
eukprot:scaffold125387_cov14-Prasinocladus_malaysianus.AAC.1